jgi:hypothetical protein
VIAFGGELQIDIDERGQTMIGHSQLIGGLRQLVGNDAQMLLTEVLRQRPSFQVRLWRTATQSICIVGLRSFAETTILASGYVEKPIPFVRHEHFLRESCRRA